MNKLGTDERKTVIRALVEGASINSTVRMTGIAKTTILRLLRDLGCACAELHNDKVRRLKPARVQCDEAWSFVHCKQKHVAKATAAPLGAGDCWTWTAVDPDTKLIITYHVGLRSPSDAAAFMVDLADRITNLTQLTTDGLTSYGSGRKRFRNPRRLRAAHQDLPRGSFKGSALQPGNVHRLQKAARHRSAGPRPYQHVHH